MPAIRGRQKRRQADDTVPLQVRVSPELRDKARRASGALSVGVSAYLEELLIRDELNEEDRPRWAAQFFLKHPEFSDPAAKKLTQQGTLRAEPAEGMRLTA